MFPRVPSHYCRSSSSREYLERSLSLKYDLKKQEGFLADDLQEKYRTHIEAKLTAREEKLKDVNACKEDETMALMCFDMQSVLTCPQMQISKAYYKKKFAVYNLTGYDMEHPSVKFITQKFQVPGHSCVQEVDAMHSVLDRYLNKLELHSPLAIFKAIINARTKKPYKVIQMQRNNFLDFKILSTCMTLSDIPYKHVVQASYENSSNIVKYNLKFGAGDLHLVQFLKGSNRQNSSRTFLQGIPEPSVQSPPKGLPEEIFEPF
nr:unnamed protein product [Callosobruchus analis]